MLFLQVLVLLLEPFFLYCSPSFDFTTKIGDCNKQPYVKPGTFQCFRRIVQADGSCDVIPLPFTPVPQNLPRMGSVVKVASPNAFRNGEYFENTLCEYHVPDCEGGGTMYVHWNKFDLEEPCDPFQDDFIVCPDHLELEDSNSDITGAFIPDFCNAFCGPQQRLDAYVPSKDMRVTFRSNGDSNAGGFIMDFECINTGATGAAGAPGPDGPTDYEENFRFTRDAEEFLGDTLQLEEDSEIEVHHRGKRFVVSPSVKTTGDCVELGGFTPPPVPTRMVNLPQNGSELQVPRGLFITYNDRVLKVFQNEAVLRTFTSISRLFFWSAINGTRVFEGSARVPLDEINGGGRLRIVGDCAYYATFESPPRFNPNSDERNVISFLLDSLNPFFADQDIVDDGSCPTPSPPPTTTMAPPTRPTRPPGGVPGMPTRPPGGVPGMPTRPPGEVPGMPTRPPGGVPGPWPTHPPVPGLRGKRDVPGASGNMKGSSFIPHRPPPPPEIDPRVSIQAFRLALRFRNACNIFLMNTARSYLNVLETADVLGPLKRRMTP